MAYREAVGYIEQMNPAFVAAVGLEYLRTKEVIKSLLPTVTALPGKMEWQSEAKELYEQRLSEATELVEGLYFAFEKAGLALLDYAEAQKRAVARVREGATAEDSLRALIAHIVSTQSVIVRLSDALRQWNDLRSTTGITDYLAEIGQRDAIEQIRPRAEALWQFAIHAYDHAIRLETEARHDTVNRLIAAYLLLPEFRAGNALTDQLVATAMAVPRSDDGQRYRLGPAAAPVIDFDHGFPFNPDAEPTPADHASWIKWSAVLQLAEASRRLDDASAAYAHYRDGTGTPLSIDYEKAYVQDSGIRVVADAEIASAQREAERIFRETGDRAFQMTGNASLGSDLVPGAYPATENWQKTIGRYFVYGTSEVVIDGDQVTMRIVVHAEDLYNFNVGGFDVATGIPDEENGRFAELGWAKEFRTSGELERTVIWTIGDPASATSTPPFDAVGRYHEDGHTND
ncbi:hypothetical protein Rhe02_89760 [Rhizocola hellebori]|uniref:Uncharacterized protein n=1 Tax=Rhizocola hellebori TaxID=1392758 RepID=A0A8J3QJK1_9ACTN|nr:hypothetical protein [Rhizocola hellebori]GIH10909.1 hypothetical protein Rhe02_89760 [Rhizocola hellebori]